MVIVSSNYSGLIYNHYYNTSTGLKIAQTVAYRITGFIYAAQTYYTLLKLGVMMPFTIDSQGRMVNLSDISIQSINPISKILPSVSTNEN